MFHPITNAVPFWILDFGFLIDLLPIQNPKSKIQNLNASADA